VAAVCESATCQLKTTGKMSTYNHMYFAKPKMTADNDRKWK